MDFFEKYKNLEKVDYENIADSSWPSFSEFIHHENIPDYIYKEIDSTLSLEKFSHVSFCILPFNGIEYPTKTFCCLTPKNTDRESVKSKMLAGQRPEECHHCWRLEDQGLRSDRMIKNESYDFYHEISLSEIFRDTQRNPQTDLTCIKLDSDNVCNATCVTCGPDSSSSWGDLLRKKTGSHHPIWSIKQQDINIDYQKTKTISFRGGEPFLSKQNFAILENLIDHGNTNCVVSFVTNGSIWPSDQQLALLQQFKNLIISLSIDGIGPVFDYLRYPLKWSVVNDHVSRWKSIGVELGISYTLSNLNVMYHDETKKWFSEQNIPFLINPVYSPKIFSITSLPKSVKSLISERIEDASVRQMLGSHCDEDDQHFVGLQKEILRQDNLKSISIKNYLPELCKILEL